MDRVSQKEELKKTKTKKKSRSRSKKGSQTPVKRTKLPPKSTRSGKSD